MAKRLYDALVAELENMLEETTVELLSIEESTKKVDDGTEEQITKAVMEIPRGNGAFSRCRFPCRLPRIQLNISEEELDEGVLVCLSGFKVTYISSQREIYTKADAIRIVQ